MKVRTSELTGSALDWAVAKAEGPDALYAWEAYHRACRGPYRYSTNWSQGGPIIEREDIDVFGCGGAYRANRALSAKHPQRNVRSRFPSDGPTKLIAAMRCVVASKLGDEVDVPEELT